MPDEPKPSEQHYADVSAQRIARVYAEALLSVGWKYVQGQELMEDLDALVNQVFALEPGLETFLTSKAVDAGRKAEVIRKAFQGRAREHFVNFLLVLNAHNRLELLRPILSEYKVLYDARLRRVQARVISAVPLSERQCERIKQEIKSAINRDAQLDVEVDPSLIGGLVLRVGDFVYDGSVRTRLTVLCDQLIERGSHAVQSGRDRFSSDSGN
jgi:F-type H+-transporting ATPase subunit delta